MAWIWHLSLVHFPAYLEWESRMFLMRSLPAALLEGHIYLELVEFPQR